MRTRTCLTRVEQQSTTIEYCNLEICRYPRPTCCYNLKVRTAYFVFRRSLILQVAHVNSAANTLEQPLAIEVP
ncbi:unnamed protein product [Strongylus vulgaris]|uniref:Uncharacterized protein n=1 Tax=Strongylus vulgaris TaxID=40348 RepID=A0A3P7L0E0_STRVU|nr:unnamed protein product [Strongylus vulgaris]